MSAGGGYNPAYDDELASALRELEALLREKRAHYGKGISRTGNMLREIYPDGIRPDQYDDLGLIVRSLDKFRRIAESGRSAGGENPWRDVAGYGVCGMVDLPPG